jgi:hypothetical protein
MKGPTSGLKLVHLRNRRDLRNEGRTMQHCIGSNGMGYDQRAGRTASGLYYSVRDSRNDSQSVHVGDATARQDKYFKCPTCGKYDPGPSAEYLQQDWPQHSDLVMPN